MTTDKNKRLFQVTAEDFKKIPGSPIAYWVSNSASKLYQGKTLKDVADPRHGLATSNNDLFLKLWFEVSLFHTSLCSKASRTKWFPMSKGGAFRRWFGNLEWLINYENDGKEIKDYATAIYKCSSRTIQNTAYYFKAGLTWSALSSGTFSVRFMPQGAIFGSGGYCAFPDAENLNLILALLNGKISNYYLRLVSPTLNYEVGHIKTIPVVTLANNSETNVKAITEKLVSTAKTDWNSYETSWDFQCNPLIETNQRNQKPGKISGAYLQLRFEWQAQCEEMRRLEVENNRIFIEAYGLQEELSPDVPWNEITLTCNPWYRYGKTPSSVDSDQWIVDRAADAAGNGAADAAGNGAADAAVDSGQWIVDRAAGAAVDSEQWIVDSEECHIGDELQIDEAGNVQVLGNTRFPASKMPFNQELETRLLTDTIKELLSYAVGCMFGRYSLDVDGLAYAGGEWDASKYTTFPADADNIIPICDDDYFEDDLTGRIVKFIETVYGTETLEENLNFIAHALGGRGSAREVIRNYFRNDFFENHCKVYQKRPIYWLFDSGKKGGFRALIYMHRYQPDTIAKMRVDYVHEQQERYRTAIADLTPRVDAASGSEKVKLAKRLTSLRDQAEEVRLYEEKIHHLADRMVSIDLDDGVKHNYAIFQDVLARIK